eukprot:gene4085-4637_t
MDEDLNCLRVWLLGNKLSLNVIKTHAMVIGSRPKLKMVSDEVTEQPCFSINGTQIDIILYWSGYHVRLTPARSSVQS